MQINLARNSLTDCPRAHPRKCSDPNCLVLDQGLPCWKTLQCRSWHAKPKTMKKWSHSPPFPTKTRTRTYSKMNDWSNFHSSTSRSTSSVHWQDMPVEQAQVPVWQNQFSSQNQCLGKRVSHLVYSPTQGHKFNFGELPTRQKKCILQWNSFG